MTKKVCNLNNIGNKFLIIFLYNFERIYQTLKFLVHIDILNFTPNISRCRAIKLLYLPTLGVKIFHFDLKQVEKAKIREKYFFAINNTHTAITSIAIITFCYRFFVFPLISTDKEVKYFIFNFSYA